MKKFNCRGFLGLGLLAVVTGLTTGCISDGDKYVSGGSLCVLITGVEGMEVSDVEGMTLNLTMVWKTQGVSQTGTAPATIVGDMACTEYLRIGVGIKDDFQILTVQGTLEHVTKGKYSGYDSSVDDVGYDSTSETLEVTAEIELTKNATQDLAARLVNEFMGKGLVKIKSMVATSDRKTKQLSEAPLSTTSAPQSSAGAAR